MRNKAIRFFSALRSQHLQFMEMLTFLMIVLAFTSCRSQIKYGVGNMHQYTVGKGNDTISDLMIQQLISVYHDSLSKSMLQNLAFSKTAMTKDIPEGNLGNYCADACFRVATKLCREKQLPKADFLFLNNGGLRSSLPAGYITIGHVYELMPFENELVMVKLNRKETDSLLTIIASKGGAPISGIRLNIPAGAPVGFSLTNSSASDKEEYYVITSDYLASGNDGFKFLQAKTPYRLNIKVRDALIADLTEFGHRNDTLNILKDGRISKQ